jgi:hypothetical protein
MSVRNVMYVPLVYHNEEGAMCKHVYMLVIFSSQIGNHNNRTGFSIARISLHSVLIKIMD